MRAALIVNADDFGYSPGVNAAIHECLAAGAIDSTTLMAGGDAFEDAVSRISDSAHPQVGVHVTLTELRALSGPGEAPGLVDPQGLLPSTPGKLLRNILLGRISRKALVREIDRQVVRVLDHGIVPTHLDTHKHVHIIPQVVEALAEVARRRYICCVRDPFEAGGVLECLPLVEREHRGAFFKQFVKARIVRTWKPAFLRTVRREGLRTPDHFIGVSLTGLWSERIYEETLRSLQPGLTEIMFHPGYVDRGLEHARTRLRESREREREVLMAPQLLELRERLGIGRGRFAG